MAGGFLADRFSKRSVMLGVKIFELLILPLVLAGLWTLNKNLLLAGVFLASGAHWRLAQQCQLSPRHIFLVVGALTFAGAIYVLFLLPDALLRFILWLATHSIYRIRIEGRDHIPAKGGALFVCNHVSFVDAPLLMAATDRKIRFIIEKSYHELWWIKPFSGMLGLIPISASLGPRELIESLRVAAEKIRDGEVVCIFAEGQITRTGELNNFQRGFERIMKNTDAPIVPVALVGVWGSLFSFERGKIFWKWPRHFFYPVTVRFGKSLPPTATPDEVREAVEKLLTTDGHG